MTIPNHRVTVIPVFSVYAPRQSSCICSSPLSHACLSWAISLFSPCSHPPPMITSFKNRPIPPLFSNPLYSKHQTVTMWKWQQPAAHDLMQSICDRWSLQLYLPVGSHVVVVGSLETTVMLQDVILGFALGLSDWFKERKVLAKKARRSIRVKS